jgi:DNA helicase-2/ATP-dependent DNA helicase PcrA
MEFIADLHIHSYLSRATAKNLNLENLNLWAQLKGITVVGTGDFTHPQWFSELSQKLQPAEDGLFELKPEFAAQAAHMVPPFCTRPVRFILSVEISSIYKKDGKTRKVHNVIFVPELEQAEKINQRLGRIGNIKSDGRPILGLDSRSLLEIVLETSEDAFLIPAHIWTPWFSVLGSKSGFDSVEECFGDLTTYIFAVETGLSSDPAMNWRVSSLDGLTLVSNSDAHSPSNLGREANLFDTDLSYFGMRDALRSGDPKRFLGTLEYFAEEGKYHFDGHRKCGVRLSPVETMKNKGLCPVCGRPVTIGVMCRVEELADRKIGAKPKDTHPYTSLLPLTDILSEVLEVGPKSKKVARAYQALLERHGPEFEILRKTSLDALERHGPPLLAEAIDRMRNRQVRIAPGYDGEFGTISLFKEEERHQLLGQSTLFRAPSSASDAGTKAQEHTAQGRRVETHTTPVAHQQDLFDYNSPRAVPHAREPMAPMFPKDNGILGETGRCQKEPAFLTRIGERLRGDSPSEVNLLQNLNEAQQEAVQHKGGPLLIVAGPGTGKTRTLTYRIAYLLLKGTARPEEVLAVTFTNKAVQEMAERLRGLVNDPNVWKMLTIKTFHALCLDIITREADALGLSRPVSMPNEADCRHMVKIAIQQAEPAFSSAPDPDRILGLISLAKQRMLSPEDDLAGRLDAPLPNQFSKMYRSYQELLSKNHLLDFDDLVFKTVRLFESNEAISRKYQGRFSSMSVDEYQDINYGQYRLVRLLAPEDRDLCVIGDPNQAIYGFRGADVGYFHRFCTDYPDAKTIFLRQNYRSTETILRASGQLIGVDDTQRAQEGMWSGIHGAKTLTIDELPTERAEAEYIVKTIEQEVGGISHFSMDSGRIDGLQANTLTLASPLKGEGSAAGEKERSFSDFAVLYRIKEQGKALQEAFARSGIPFQMVGNKKLQNRKGIMELISYLKAGWSLAGDLDLERILNFPSRGIGGGTIRALKQWSEMKGCSLMTALKRSDEISGLKPASRRKLRTFSRDLCGLKELLSAMSVCDQIHHILDQFRIMDAMSGNKAFEQDLAAFSDLSGFFKDRGVDFLAHLALEKAQDRYDRAAERVSLMTMHAAKGLEFPVVFIAGCEDGLIPYRTKKPNEGDVQEERRLFYVALTRAQEKIYLTHAKRRLWFGKRTLQHASPFLGEVEEELKEHKKPFSARRARKKEDMQLRLFQL